MGTPPACSAVRPRLAWSVARRGLLLGELEDEKTLIFLHVCLIVSVPKRRILGTAVAANTLKTMARPQLKLIAPTPINGTVPPRRQPNKDLRPREYLTADEVSRLMKTAGKNRHGHRDATMILLAFRHGLRAAELVTLRWDNVDLMHGKLHVNRVKNGSPAVHPISGVELRALRRLKRDSAESPFVFVSERGAPFSTAGFRKMIARLGVEAKFAFGVHPHMLRHATGYHLANKGHDTRSLQHYLGHKSIQHTVRYTELTPDRFKDFWTD